MKRELVVADGGLEWSWRGIRQVLIYYYLHIHFVTEFEFIRFWINRDPALISAFFSSLNKYQSKILF